MASKVFVYNQAALDESNVKKKGVLELTFGLFFDGTRNNRRNTEIRIKVKELDVKNYGKATPEERRIYNKEAKKFKLSSLSRKEIGDDSFANDFTNIARMSMCCDEANYAIYIEGAGTEDEKSGSTKGYAYGAGETGIRKKVRKGCEKLAEKIHKKKYKIKGEIKSIIVNVDAHGFSRGAAAARNFIYEIQKKPYLAKTKSGNDDGEFLYFDSFDEESFFNDDNGMLPRLGHLGAALLELDFSREELELVKIKPRFIGIYDTVSSYSKTLLPYFRNDVGQLHLNELGRFKKIVHFTAQDEHRENFALTRIKGGGENCIEKNFPGVHSDVGGSYLNGTETVKELENSFYLLNKFDILKLQAKLIKEDWFTEEQLKVKTPFFNMSTFVLEGIRNLKKEYSYIPLHFMKDYAFDFIEDFIIKDVEKEYSIDHDDALIEAKRILKKYVMEGGEEWKYISDERVALNKKMKKRLNQTKEENKEAVNQIRLKELTEGSLKEKDYGISRASSAVFDRYKGTEKEYFQKELERTEELKRAKELKDAEEIKKFLDEGGESLEEVVIVGYTEQNLLRKLRGEYLHWSANRSGVGFDPPTFSRKRSEY